MTDAADAPSASGSLNLRTCRRQLDEAADRSQSVGLQTETERLQDKIKKVRQRMHQWDELKTRRATPQHALS